MKIIHSTQVFFFLLLLTLATLTIAQEVEGDESEFNYVERSDNGLENWGNIKPEWVTDNSGTVQSLIDLPPRIVESVPESEKIFKSYQPDQTTIRGRYIKNQVIKEFGPYGSQLVGNYRFRLGRGERFKEIVVRHGYVVDSIGFVVARENGGTSTKHFGGHSGRLTRIRLRDNENITRISGTYGNYRHQNNNVIIGTLTIHTNLNRAGYGPYGQGRDLRNIRAFTSKEIRNHPVVGVFGRHNNLLESIGVFIIA